MAPQHPSHRATLPATGSPPPGADAYAAPGPSAIAVDLGDLLGPAGDSRFLVRVAGRSMVGAQLHPGDLLIVDRGRAPRPGEIVVAWLQGGFTLKRLIHRGGHTWLEASTDGFPPLSLSALEGQEADTARIWGVVTHALRRLGPAVSVREDNVLGFDGADPAAEQPG